MKTKCPIKPRHIPKEENHQYAPRYDIMPHPKNAWQNPKNPLAHPKCVNNL
jgi:hypothetical protein